MTNEEIRDLLFIGESTIEVCGITLYEYTIREIYKMGKDKFRRAMYFSALEPIDLFKRSEVKKEDFKGITMFDMMPVIGDENIKWCETMLSMATKRSWTYNKATNNFDSVEFIDGIPKIYRINKTNYNEITNAIRIMFSIFRYDPYEKYGDYDKADDFVKEIIDEEVEKDTSSEKQTVNFSSIVEGVSCHRDSGFNALTIGDITIYQLFRIYERIQQKTVFDNNMRAMYSGCMSKENKINMNDISWVKNLDI